MDVSDLFFCSRMDIVLRMSLGAEPCRVDEQMCQGACGMRDEGTGAGGTHSLSLSRSQLAIHTTFPRSIHPTSTTYFDSIRTISSSIITPPSPSSIRLHTNLYLLTPHLTSLLSIVHQPSSTESSPFSSLIPLTPSFFPLPPTLGPGRGE